MTSFDSLTELTDELEEGDKILWIGSSAIDGVGETSKPNKVTNIERDEDVVRVYGRGVGGGEYCFKVEDGKSEAYYFNPNEPEPRPMGEVVVARITDSDEPVPVKRVYDDIREESVPDF